MLLSLYTTADVQQLLADNLRQKRKVMKLSRQALADRSTVPASTIKKFEMSGQISLRQFLLLWQCVDSLSTIVQLLDEPTLQPRTIDEVLNS
ncbi:MAG: hypothetical protein KAG12_02585 [Desulfuromusa sp.]|nr:hypothetical protein [Desulfuromusa sp.]